MRTGAPAWYARIVGVFLLVQGVVTGTFLLVDPLDKAFPVLLDATRMIPQHSSLHVLTGLLALAVLRWGGARELSYFALGFGLFYTALGVSGLVSGHGLGLGLQPFDHPFHLFAGIPGLLAAGLGQSGRRGEPVRTERPCGPRPARSRNSADQPVDLPAEYHQAQGSSCRTEAADEFIRRPGD